MNINRDSIPFLPAGFFMTRSPLLPLSNYLDNCSMTSCNQTVVDLFSNPIVKEAILLASPSLYFSLKKATEKKDAISRKQFSSLLRYLIRMSTRPTPFGLFSAVGFGVIDQVTKITLDARSELNKFSRLSLEWLYEIVSFLEKDIEIVRKCKVKSNAPIVSYANRLFLLSTRNIDTGKNNEQSIKKSLLTDFILKNSADWILYESLEHQLIKKFSDLNSEKLKAFLYEVFKNQFLISELSPSLLDSDPFATLLQQLRNINPKKACSLQPLADLILDYNRLAPGEGVDLLEKIQHICKIYGKEGKTYGCSIQTDVAFPSVVSLSSKVAEEGAKAAAFLWKINPASPKASKLSKYHLQFVEKYGIARLIPFSDLINNNTGLGLPSYISSNREMTDNVLESLRLERFLLKKFHEAIYFGEKEVVITDSDIEKYVGNRSKLMSPPVSMELFCEVLSKDQASIDQGDFQIVLSPSQLSQQLGSSFGRFLHVLPKEAKNAISEAYLSEQKLEPEKIFVELSWLPTSGRAANIAVGESLRNFVLIFPPNNENRKESIPIDDIYVGASHRGLYLFSKHLKRKIVLSRGNVLNQDLAAPPLEFLLDISKGSAPLMQGVPWDQLDYLSYLPRLRYGKTYLSPARWHLRLKDLISKERPSKEKLKNPLLKWMKKWKVSRFVMVSYFDQYLLLDLTKDAHLAELLENLIKTDTITLVEKISIEKSVWAKSMEGPHFTEIVIPLLRNKSYPSDQHVFSIESKRPEYSLFKSSDRIKELGSDWVYLKLFCDENIHQEFLQTAVSTFINHIHAQKICKQWFYIRYQENNADPHIRLRMNICPSRDLQKILAAIRKWTNYLMDNGWIKESSFHIYERELERYGGIDLIESAEKVFSADSQVCLSLLQHHKKITTLPLYAISTLSIIDFLTVFGLSIKEQIDYLEENFLSREALEGYRYHSKELTDLALSLREKTKETTLLRDIFLLRHGACREYIEKALSADFSLSSSEGREAVHSILHMHCNRLLGINRTLEEKSKLYAIKTLERLYVLEKKKSFCSY